MLSVSCGCAVLLTLYTKTQLVFYQLQRDKGESIGDEYAIGVLHRIARYADYCLWAIGLCILCVGAFWVWRHVKSRKAVDVSEISQLT